MTLKIRGKKLSVKVTRRLDRIPASKRLRDIIRAGWLRRYFVKNTATGRAGPTRSGSEG